MDAYFPEIEHAMQRYYHSLSEKDRRRYAAIEAIKLGHGGISYISKLFDCHPKPIRRGIAELQDEQVLNEQRIRQPGGGRKRVVETMDGLSEAFLRIIEHNTAGSPVDASIKWTHLSRQQIADLLSEEAGLSVSVTVVDQLLKQHHFRRRKASKTQATGAHPQRNEQFEKIEQLVGDYQQVGNPVMSMDTKKRS
jgi:hypothetical protein